MAHIITSTTVTLIHEGKVMSMSTNDKLAVKFIKLINKGMFSKAKKYYEDRKDVTKYLVAPFSIVQGKLHYNEEPTNHAISKRVIAMIAGGFDIKYMLLFLKNLYTNPSKRAVDELYGFLEANDLPITTTGEFLAYKRIRADWTDCYTSKISNSIGKTVSMDRNKVDDNKDKTCSEGLHVASLEYLKHYFGDRLVAVAINPRDVVSVPTDYNNSKMRVCKYTVVEELDMKLVGGEVDAWETPVHGQPEDELGLWCHE